MDVGEKSNHIISSVLFVCLFFIILQFHFNCGPISNIYFLTDLCSLKDASLRDFYSLKDYCLGRNRKNCNRMPHVREAP